MAMDLNVVTQRARTVAAGFTPGQKAMVGLAVIATIVGGYLVTKWASTPEFTALYSNLSVDDASAVTEELGSRGVSYRLGDGGRTVLVPRKDVYQLRLDMSAQGLPTQGAAGYALLDKQGITTSEFRQRVDFQRAVEGELVKTITAIDGVDAANVHLVIPEEDLFTDDASHASASVLVRPRADRGLSAGQVQAIVHLVASSVEGLTPGNVTVADASGKVLSAPGDDGLLAAAGDARSQQTQAFEERLAGSLEDLLTPVVGAGHSVVRVTAALDFDRRSRTLEQFDDEAAPALAESTVTETYTGGSPTAGGVLGPDGAPLGGTGNTDYQKEQAERSFAVSKVTEQVETAPGSVNRLSIAVLLDEGSEADAADVERLVAAAAGLDTERGDTIEVSRMAFDTAAAEAAEAELAERERADQQATMMQLARTGAAILLVLVVLFFAWRSARKASVRRYPVPLPMGVAPPAGAIGPADGAASAIAGAGGAGNGEPTLASVQIGTLPSAERAPLPVESEVGHLIDRQPDEVAQVLRGWLADRRS